MASFTINFQANTTGEHYIGYRETSYMLPPNHDVETVNVTVPGLQTLEIEIPDNVYCITNGLSYAGYVVAACQLQFPEETKAGTPNVADDQAPSDGVPDLAQTWTVDIVQQTDPCKKTEILCESVAVDDVTWIDGTGACTDGVHNLVFTEATPGDEIIAAVGTVTVAGGVVTSTNITVAGQYKAPPVVTDDGGPACGTPPVYTPVMGQCPSLDLSTYTCAGTNTLSGTPQYDLDQAATIEICADASTLVFLPDNFVPTEIGDCHCEECVEVSIDAPFATTGVGKITYTTCWDGNHPLGTNVLVTREVNPTDAINLNCILEDTIVIDNGTLDQPILISNAPCPS